MKTHLPACCSFQSTLLALFSRVTKITSIVRVTAALGVLVLSSSTSLHAAPNGESNFDSAHQVALDGVIRDGYLLSTSPSSRHEAEVKQQIKYAMGYFNNLEGGTQHPELKVTILERIPVGNRVTRVRYAAELLVSWSIDRRIPSSLMLILPERADSGFLRTFFSRYRQGCTSESAATAESYWYYYRPLYSYCPLRAARAGDLAARVQISLQKSALNTTGKSPEYGKIWEDGQLTATIISGKYEPGAGTSADVGVAGYNAIYTRLINTLGRPVQSIPSFSGVPGTRFPEVRLKFNLAGNRTAVIHLFLVDELASAGGDFIEKYNRLSENADLVIYNGHSGLGANIEAFGQMGRFKPGKYQVFLINGCDTLSYADDSLFRAHARVNPGAAGSKYLDLITNAMPSFFHSMDEATVNLVSSVISSRLTYRQILSRLDPYQRAVVMGEEDNRWPQPF